MYLEILRAAKIIHQMNRAHATKTGAFGLDIQGDAHNGGSGGGKEMIDAPMLKQVRIELHFHFV
jgi:citrate lyase subunit beta-like protein